MSAPATVTTWSPPTVEDRPSWQQWLAAQLDPDWRAGEWDSQRRVFTGRIGNPMTSVFACRVERCNTQVENHNRRCSRCRRYCNRSGDQDSFDRTFDPDAHPRPGPEPAIVGHFDLSGVDAVLAEELLYGLSQRDRDNLALVPARVRRIVVELPPSCESLLLLAGDAGFENALPADARGVFRSIVTHLLRAHTVFTGTDPTLGDIWNPAVVGLQAAADRHYRAVGGVVDFRGIDQLWLREVTKRFAREIRPPVTVLRQTIHAVEIASRQLSLRSNGDRHDLLDIGDMSAVIDGFRGGADRNGVAYSVSHQRGLLGCWRRMIEHSRRSGAMDAVPGGFAIDPRFHSIAPVEITEDDLGRTIPEHVIAQLDAHIDLLGSHSSYAMAGWAATDFARMYQTVYKILRDTGRRPNEITSLRRGCLDWVEGKPTLIYDNHKRRRMGRRLPIHQDTATVIRSWLDHLEQLSVPDTLHEWVFPTPGTRNNIRRGHLTSQHFGTKVFASWTDAIPEIVDQRLDDAGNPIPFDRSVITPYGLRHAYAQRHADNGTPVDVLCELMDHRSIETTMGYYSISLKRKRSATEKIAAFVVDRSGRPAAFTSATDYERQSVAVPFGNCTEPSNIKAGGQRCPVRFQCAGCSFYAPDPSYLPAIEQHVASLRADKEVALATDAADWVIGNFDAQISAFSTVVTSMADMLAGLPPEQRAGVEDAARELRKARQAAAFIPLASITTRKDARHGSS
ncbi:tyrosine-type recombinase/integrase [Nocardia sp. NPDC060249]|uniref:tyrosine-type recombinase/integrase n=1 Tax=Nocardia sp. NPDC060249 TaxID=3347082 RepID=UPI003655BDE5